MPYQKISAVITPEQIAAAKALVAQFRALFPFLQTLTTSERIKMYKMGPKRLAWVQACVNAAKNHPSVLPGFFNLAEMEKDFELAKILADLREVAKGLFSDLDDTTMGVGSEAASAASDVMGWVDAAADTQPGLKTVSEQLHSFFQQANDAAAATPPPAK